MASSWTGIAGAHSTTTTYVVNGVDECGRLLNDDHSTYVLTAHVGPCPGDGLVITAAHVTLDLGGFKIFGDGEGNGTGRTTSPPDSELFLGDAGVRVQNGVTGFTITGERAVNCADTAAARESNVNAIVGFDAGIRVGRSPGTATNSGLIKQLHLRDNLGSLESDYGDGISIDNSSYITVNANCIRHNGFLAGVGVYEDPNLDPVTGCSTCTHHISITNNVIVDNDLNSGPVGVTGFSSQTYGVRFEPGVQSSLVESNTITRSGLDGVGLFAGTSHGTNDNVVKKNTITANGFHENVTDAESHIRNGPDGALANSTPPGPTGYAQFAHRKGSGIRVFGFSAAQNAENNTIGGPTSGTPGRGGTGDGNLVCGNAADGIRVDGGAKRVSAPSTWTGQKNTIQNNTSGGGSATCAYNDVEDAPAPNLAYDYHDGNESANALAGMSPACGSNTWSGNKDFDGVAPDSTRSHTCIG